VQQFQHTLNDQERLLLTVAEQLKVPFVQIAHLAEQSKLEPSSANWQTVRATAAAALGLVESYALSLRLHGNLDQPELVPMTVSSLLYDTAQELSQFAKQYNVELELDASAHLLPIMGDRAVLQSALTSLGYVFVEASTAVEKRSVVRLAAYRTRYGIVAGLYSSMPDFGADSLRRAHQLHGRARQPLQQLAASPAAGVFVADSLLQTLSARLHVARYHKLTGLAATLVPSQQLQLV